MAKENGITFTLNDNDKIKFSKTDKIKIHYTLAFVGGVSGIDNGGPIGMLMCLGTKDFSIYLDMKWGSPYNYMDVENWSNETILSQTLSRYEAYPGSFANGTYVDYESKKISSSGSIDTRKKTTNIGFSKRIGSDNDIYLKAHVGLGLTNFETLNYEKISNEWSKFTWWNLIQDYNYSSGGYETYELKSTTSRTELNVNAGITLNLWNYFSGISFDVNPGCINFSVGVTF